MNPETLILAATVLGLFLNAIAVLGIAWRGGNILGRLDTTMEQLSADMVVLQSQAPLLYRVTAIVDELERRVTRLENAKGAR